MQPISCFTRHNGPLFCCLWSPFTPSLAITTGQEGLICIWNTEEQEAKLPVEKSRDASKIFLEEAKDAHVSGNFNNLVLLLISFSLSLAFIIIIKLLYFCV